MDINIEAVYIDKLHSSGLSFQDAEKLQFQNCSVEQTATLHASFKANQAIRIPFFNTDGSPIIEDEEQFYRIRYLYTTLEEAEAKKNNVKLPRYRQKPGTSSHLYIPLLTDGFTWSNVAHDVEVPLFFTEGELKASKACKEGYPCMSICGVWNFQVLKKGKFLIDEFYQFTLKKRKVYICYDSDVMTNDKVLKALFLLTDELEKHGAIPYVVTFPNVLGEKKVGLDDFMVYHENQGNECRGAFNTLVANAVYCGITKELFNLNDRYCYVQHPGAIVFKPTGTLLQKDKFKDALLNKRVLKKTINKFGEEKFQEISAAIEWMKWPIRESANSLCYEPGKDKIIEETIKDCDVFLRKYNTWRGWGVKPQKGDVSDFLEYFNAICNRLTEDEKKWFMSWIAWPIQNPGCKLFTAVVLYSIRHGNGKSLLGEIIGKLYGDHYILLNKELLENNQFNEWSIEKSFILADEITSAKSRKSLDRLKLMITQSKLSINKKGFNLYTIRDTINYMFTTNHCDAFHLEDDDRRFFVVEVPKILTSEQLSQIACKYLTDEKKSGYLFDYFLNYPISSNFNPHWPAPTTKAKDSMRELGLSELGSFVRTLKSDPETISLNIGDIISTDEALIYLRQSEMVTDNHRRTITKQGITREFASAGIDKLQDGRQFRTATGRKRFYILKNYDKWQKATPEEIRDYCDLKMIKNNNFKNFS